MKKLSIILLCVLICLLSLCGCNKKAEDNKKIIAVSIAPEADFVKKVCGDKFNVITLVPAGASPESYEMDSVKMRDVSKAVIYFAIGVPAEPNSILPIISEKTEIISLHEKATKEYPELYIGKERDPHIWLSPKRVIAMVEEIEAKLSRIDPKNKDFYNANAKSYTLELQELDKYIIKSFSDKTKRKFISLHPAFGYFAEDYSLEMHALEKDGSEATAKDIAKMADLAKKEDIKTIFYQAEASEKNAKAFAEEIGGQAVMLEPLSENYTESMQEMTDLLKEAMN